MRRTGGADNYHMSLVGGRPHQNRGSWVVMLCYACSDQFFHFSQNLLFIWQNDKMCYNISSILAFAVLHLFLLMMGHFQHD